MNLHSRIIGFGIVAVLVGWALAAGGQPSIFFNLPSLLMVLGVIVGGLWACFGPQLVVQAWGAGLLGCRDFDLEKLPLYIAVFERAYALAWAGGIVATFIGLIIMLANMADPSSIGSGMAVALLAVLYGAFLAEFVFKTLQQTLLNQLAAGPEHGRTVPTSPRSLLALGSVAVLIALFIFAAMWLALSELHIG